MDEIEQILTDRKNRLLDKKAQIQGFVVKDIDDLIAKYDKAITAYKTV
jgi:hypothetical protein